MQATDTAGHRSSTATLTLGALGVVFGDIGTSPLYALKECFHASHGLAINDSNVLGILSLIFWSITIIVSLKYIAFIMRADNNGEGGIMALLALTLRNEVAHPTRRRILIMIGLFGAALFFGDGIITPAISVLSAVEGLEVATPGFQPFIIPITIAVLITLFVIQRHGTGSVGRLFGPVMVLWFAALTALGVYNIQRNPHVLQAVNPAWALDFVAAHGFVAFITLGAVVLTITGGEALYADMGHFGRRPIRLAWFYMVFPALLVNYCGQGALLLSDPHAVENPFYRLAPQWGLIPLVMLATVATVIASQAVISGVFSITRQAVQLGYLPRLDIQHTSSREIGQIYIPAVNWALLGAIILLVLSFKSSSNLASAYGIAVTLTMICDTVLAVVVARTLWQWHPLAAAAIAIPFLVVDFSFFAATSLKVLQGGWFPLMVGLTAFIVMSTWKEGRQLLFRRLANETMPLGLFVNSIGGGSVQTVPGTAVFMTGSHQYVPHAMLHNMKHNKVLHERNVLLTLVTRDIPFVDEKDRLTISEAAHNFYLIYGYYGFKEQPDVPALMAECAARGGLEFDMMDTSFFLSRERIIASVAPGMAMWREKLFVAMSRNAAAATDFFQIPTNRVVELGTQVEI
ncbi:MAG TPA: potassium transporter Kup [Moraxellaceae bacterium]|nr:potassium transporter Kup [Moraxellaceae bacterium]